MPGYKTFCLSGLVGLQCCRLVTVRRLHLKGMLDIYRLQKLAVAAVLLTAKLPADSSLSTADLLALLRRSKQLLLAQRRSSFALKSAPQSPLLTDLPKGSGSSLAAALPQSFEGRSPSTSLIAVNKRQKPVGSLSSSVLLCNCQS